MSAEVVELRKNRNEAWKAFQANPTDETKARYQAAQSAYYSARKTNPIDSSRSWPTPVGLVSSELDAARLEANAANRAMYAHPNQETREAARLARNYYSNLRRKLDPEAKAKHTAAHKKWKQKKSDSSPKE